MNRTPCYTVLPVVAALFVAAPVSSGELPVRNVTRSADRNLDLYGDALPPGAFARLGTVRFRSTGGLFVRAALSADGKLLAVAGERLIRLLDPQTGVELRRLVPPAPAAGRAAFSANRRFLAVAGDNRIQVYDLVDSKWLPALTYEGTSWCDRLVVSGSESPSSR